MSSAVSNAHRPQFFESQEEGRPVIDHPSKQEKMECDLLALTVVCGLVYRGRATFKRWFDEVPVAERYGAAPDAWEMCRRHSTRDIAPVDGTSSLFQDGISFVMPARILHAVPHLYKVVATAPVQG